MTDDISTEDIEIESPVFAVFCAATRDNPNRSTTTQTIGFTLKASSYYEAVGMAEAVSLYRFPECDGWRRRPPIVVATDVGLTMDEVVAKIDEEAEASPPDKAEDDEADEPESPEDAHATADRIARINASSDELRGLCVVGSVLTLSVAIAFAGGVLKNLPMIMVAFAITVGCLISLRWIGRPK